MSATISDLYNAISAVCPIVSVNSDGIIVYASGVTTAQQTAAQAIVSTWLNGTFVAPATITQAIASGYAYLASQGWGQTNLTLVQNKFALGDFTGTLLTQFQANCAVVASMYAAAVSNPTSFQPTSYVMPNQPSAFGLNNSVTL